MIEGALILLAGVIVGRLLPNRRPKYKPVQAICGCHHSVSFHKDGKGKCKRKDGWGEECPCQHYVGPVPVEQFFATPTLPPSDL